MSSISRDTNEVTSPEPWYNTPWYDLTKDQNIKATMVVPQPLDQVQMRRSKTANWVKYNDKNNEYDQKMAREAQIIDWRIGTQVDKSVNCLGVFWASKTVHMGNSTRKSYPKYPKFGSNGTTGVWRNRRGHFKMHELKEANDYLNQRGYVVIDFEMNENELKKYIDLFKTSIQLMNKEVIDTEYPTCPRLSKISKKHFAPYIGKGLMQFYGAAHLPFADACRKYEPLVEVFRFFHKTSELLPSFDCIAATKKTEGGDANWLHADQDLDHDYLSVQCNLIFKSPWARLSMMVSHYPANRHANNMSAHLKQLREARLRGASMTHDNDHVNKEPLPTFRPNPNDYLHLKVINKECNIDGYMERFELLIAAGLKNANDDTSNGKRSLSDASECQQKKKRTKVVTQKEVIDLT